MGSTVVLPLSEGIHVSVVAGGMGFPNSGMIPGIPTTTSQSVGSQPPIRDTQQTGQPVVSTAPLPASSGLGVPSVFNSSVSRTASKDGAASPATLVEQLNHKLYPQGLEAVFQFDSKSHLTWLNIVNKATGQVVQKWPPERIRQMVDGADKTNLSQSGLSFDYRL